MWRSRVFWKVFLAYVGLNLMVVIALALIVPTGNQLLWFVALASILGVLLVSYWTVRRILQPVQQLISATEAITAGDYSRPVDTSRRDELGQLAEAFDKMRREIQDRLTESREIAQRLTTVLGGMSEGVVAVGANRNVLLANTAARRMLELSTQPVQGAPLAEVLSDVQLRKTALEVLRRPASHNLTLHRNGTTQRVLGVSATPMPGNPCPGMVLVLHDETELRRLETLRQEFVANVSHELKTPLSSIKAYAETLSQGAINDPQNNLRFVARIEEQADRLHQLILDLLRLARIESGQQTFEIGVVDVTHVIGACLEGCRDAAKSKSIRLICEKPESDVQVRADEEGLRQILDNLIDNAIKYTPEGGAVTVRWGRFGTVVRLEVQDTGIGIPAEFQPRVFERFFRVDKARSRELGGTGLGLSIVKHLAQSFGGSASVQSTPGQGSMFLVELPAV